MGWGTDSVGLEDLLTDPGAIQQLGAALLQEGQPLAETLAGLDSTLTTLSESVEAIPQPPSTADIVAALLQTEGFQTALTEAVNTAVNNQDTQDAIGGALAGDPGFITSVGDAVADDAGAISGITQALLNDPGFVPAVANAVLGNPNFVSGLSVRVNNLVTGILGGGL